MHQRLLQMSTQQVYNTSRAVFQILQTQEPGLSTSPVSFSPVTLIKKWLCGLTARTPPRLGYTPAALRPSHVSAAEHMFAHRGPGSRSATISSHEVPATGAGTAFRLRCFIVADSASRATASLWLPHQSPPRKSIRAGLGLPEKGRLKDFYETGAVLGKDHFLALSWHDIVRQGRVLCKIVMTDPLSSAELRALIEISIYLAHPNICNLVEVFAESAFCVSLVFELCAGGELFDAIVRRDHFSESEAQDIMRGLVKGVAYLHSNCIVHRDLKPENILISRANGDLRHLKIADFGFATRIDPKHPHQLTRCRTPGYRAQRSTPGGYGLRLMFGLRCDHVYSSMWIRPFSTMTILLTRHDQKRIF